jgi:hypothetical protein
LHQKSIQILRNTSKSASRKNKNEIPDVLLFFCKTGLKARFGLCPLATRADGKTAHGGLATPCASPPPPRPQPGPGPTKRGPTWVDFGPANLGRSVQSDGQPSFSLK